MQQAEMINFTIDSRSAKAPKGTRLIIAAERIGIHIPRFCHHDALKPYGGCRMCLVEIEKMPKLQTSCTVDVQEGMVIHTNNERVRKARKAILEFILINHPLDCPVCDKGGECELQNQYYEYSSQLGRFTENKIFNFHRKINSTIEQDFNRCLQCKRCVRFSYEIASDDIIIYENRAVHTTVTTFNNKPYESVYSGNVIELCPVGALTDRTWRFSCRPWELKHHASVCNMCSQNCHIDLQSRNGEVQRIFARSFEPINESWICDRGRFGHQFLKSDERIREPLERKNGKWEPISWKHAYELIIGKLRTAIEQNEGSSVAGIIENDHTLEELLAFKKLMRDVIGTIHFDSYPNTKGLRSEKGDYFLSNLPTFSQVAESDAVINLGADLISEAPLLALKIRRNQNDPGTRVFNLMIHPTETSKLLDEIIIPVDQYAIVIAEIVRQVSQDEKVSDVLRNKIISSLTDFKPPVDDWMAEVAKSVSSHIKSDKSSLILGKWILKHDSPVLRIAKILIELMGLFSSMPVVMPLLNGGNAVGAELMKVHPLLMSNSPSAAELTGGLGSDEILPGALSGKIKILLVFSHRFGMNIPEYEWIKGSSNLEYIIRADYFHSPLNDYANLLLPLASIYEKSGHVVNNEGRFDFMSRGARPKQGITPTLEIIARIAQGLGSEIDFSSGALLNEILIDPRFGDKLTPGGFVFVNEERSSMSRLMKINPHPLPAKNDKYPFILVTHQPFWQGDERLMKSPDVGLRLPDFSVMMNPQDASSLEIKHGDEVEISSEHGSIKSNLNVHRTIPKGYILLPEGYIEKKLNSLFLSVKDYLQVQIRKI